MEIKVISLENHKGMQLGDTKKVRRGHARYLIQSKKALRYDKTDINKFSAMKASLEAEEAKKLQQATDKSQQLKTLSIQLKSRTANEKRLYGSLGAKEIAEAITRSGVPVEKRNILLPEGLIREVGTHKVVIHLHDQVNIEITIQVLPSL